MLALHNDDILKILMKVSDWNKSNKYGMTPIECILTTDDILQVVVQEIKVTVSKMMIRTSDDREITKTPIIFALEKILNENIIKVLVAAAKTQDIVDLVLYSKSVVSTFEAEDSNPRKKRRLD